MPDLFTRSWISVDLGKYRPCDSTYAGFNVADLPPLDRALLDGSYRWLSGKPVKPNAGAEKRVAALQTRVSRAGRALPPAFSYLMSRPKLYGEIPSCTACEWDLGLEPIANAAEEGAYTVRFLRDQQDVFLWYLYLPVKGEPFVLCSRIPFDEPQVRADKDIDRGTVQYNSAQVASDFESFVYRFWLENTLWDKLNSEGASFTPVERAYLDHYTRKPRPKPKKRKAR